MEVLERRFTRTVNIFWRAKCKMIRAGYTVDLASLVRQIIRTMVKEHGSRIRGFGAAQSHYDGKAKQLCDEPIGFMWRMRTPCIAAGIGMI